MWLWQLSSIFQYAITHKLLKTVKKVIFLSKKYSLSINKINNIEKKCDRLWYNNMIYFEKLKIHSKRAVKILKIAKTQEIFFFKSLHWNFLTKSAVIRQTVFDFSRFNSGFKRDDSGLGWKHHNIILKTRLLVLIQFQLIFFYQRFKKFITKVTKNHRVES